MLSKQPLLNLSLGEAAVVTALAVAVMGYTIIALEWVPHLSILLAITALLLYGLARGAKWESMMKRMAASVEQGMGAVYLFFFIGLLVSALMMGGAIALRRCRHLHRQQSHHLRHRRCGVYGHERGVSGCPCDYGGRSGLGRVFRRQNVAPVGHHGHRRLHRGRGFV